MSTKKQQAHKGAQKKGNPTQRTTAKKVSQPIAQGSKMITKNPVFKQGSRPGCYRVEKEEYIADISGNEDPWGIVGQFVVNAADFVTFPWLSEIALMYESYKFLNLAFELRTQAPTTTPGYSALTLDYNPNQEGPVDKSQAFEMEETVRCPVWSDVKHISTQKNLTKRKSYFVDGPDVDDVKIDSGLYDVGNLFVQAGNQTSENSVGELWVKYDVELETPQFETISDTCPSLHVLGGSSGKTLSKPLGTNMVVKWASPSFVAQPSAGYPVKIAEKVFPFIVLFVNFGGEFAALSSAIMQILGPGATEFTNIDLGVPFAASTADPMALNIDWPTALESEPTLIAPFVDDNGFLEPGCQLSFILTADTGSTITGSELLITSMDPNSKGSSLLSRRTRKGRQTTRSWVKGDKRFPYERPSIKRKPPIPRGVKHEILLVSDPLKQMPIVKDPSLGPGLHQTSGDAQVLTSPSSIVISSSEQGCKCCACSTISCGTVQ